MSNKNEQNVPRHIAVIMDGNGRWATKRLLPKVMGHRQGAENLKKIARHCNKIGVETLTVYAFSTENWRRSEEEVTDLMKLLEEYIRQFYVDEERGLIRINIIGDISKLSPTLQNALNEVMEESKDHKGLKLNIAINYGGRDEITRAAKRLSADVLNGSIDVDNIDESTFNSYLDTAEDVDPELVIRTSGEFRLSNYLLWQVAYSEFYVTDTLWPDFSTQELEKAINSFGKRDRRFGGRKWKQE